MAAIGSMSEPTLPALLYKSKSAALFIIDIWCNSPQYVNDGMLVMHHFSNETRSAYIFVRRVSMSRAISRRSLDQRRWYVSSVSSASTGSVFAYSTDVSQLGYSRAISAILAFTSAAFPHHSSVDRGQGRLQLVCRCNL